MHYSEHFHIRKDKTNPRRLGYLILFLCATPPAWPLMLFGAVLVAAGVFLHGWAAGYLARAGYEERESVLTVRGPYRHNRNPYYLAHLTMDFGFFCTAGLPLLYLLYFPVIFLVYRTWVKNEERFLVEEFGDGYSSLKLEVPRWRFRLRPAPPRGPEQSFEWATFLLNREFSRSLRHLILLGLFAAFFFAGNPFLQVDALARATGIGTVAAWLALRDVYPVGDGKKSVVWMAIAVSIAAAITAALAWFPVLEVWPPRVAWGSLAAGCCLGLFVSATSFPAFTRATGKKPDDIFSRPICQWYFAGLALGLISCTYGGVWIGLTAPVVVWALGISGLVPLKLVPQRAFAGVALLAVLATAAAISASRLVG